MQISISLKAVVLVSALLGSLCGFAQARTEMASGPIPVTIERDDAGFYLTRGGERYEVRGLSGFDYLDEAVAAGATTIRTWGIDNLQGGKLLDEAHQRGLTVMVGLWMGHKRDGFDYGNPAQVEEQYKRLTAEVLKYKDHPAILAWGVGNEAEARGGQPYEAMNDIAKFIHEHDPYHPTVAVLAGSAIDRIQAVRDRAPHIDILAINTYNAYRNVPVNVRKAGWEGPYMVTEVGIDGTWSTRTTEWGAPIEPASGVKADTYEERCRMLLEDRERCLGIFPFKWGYIPKGTSTWFSLFHAQGEPNAVVDVVARLYTGQWPQDRAPRVMSITINDRQMHDSLRLEPGEQARAMVTYHLPNAAAGSEDLELRWEVTPESEITDAQGSQEVAAAIRGIAIDVISDRAIRFTAPETPGPYRLFFYCETAAGKIGTANFPFHVGSN